MNRCPFCGGDTGKHAPTCQSVVALRDDLTAEREKVARLEREIAGVAEFLHFGGTGFPIESTELGRLAARRTRERDEARAQVAALEKEVAALEDVSTRQRERAKVAEQTLALERAASGSMRKCLERVHDLRDPAGHDGDEESNTCEEDCEKCFVDGLKAQAEHVLSGDAGRELLERVRRLENDLRTLDVERVSDAHQLATLREWAREAYRALGGLKLAGECWCEVAIGNPNYRGIHSPSCDEARRTLASAPEGVR